MTDLVWLLVGSHGDKAHGVWPSRESAESAEYSDYTPAPYISLERHPGTEPPKDEADGRVAERDVLGYWKRGDGGFWLVAECLEGAWCIDGERFPEPIEWTDLPPVGQEGGGRG